MLWPRESCDDMSYWGAGRVSLRCKLVRVSDGPNCRGGAGEESGAMEEGEGSLGEACEGRGLLGVALSTASTWVECIFRVAVGRRVPPGMSGTSGYFRVHRAVQGERSCGAGSPPPHRV